MSDDEILAAEYALGLLEGQELLDARNRATTDDAFARDVAAWQERFAPLLNDIAPVQPRADLWSLIERRISGASGGEVHQLARKVRFWKSVSAATTAAAAAAAAALLLLPTPPQPPQSPVTAPTPAPVLVASLASEEGPTSLAVTYAGTQREIVITPGRVGREAGRDHELWLIPAGQAPVSLGLVQPSGVQRRRLDPALAAQVASGATIALSLEPSGGSPTGAPTGPVLAAGTLNPV
ncbi:hypothetical protein G7077_11010 [Sphingomonas piscis]|uniref:Anti-sigma K factor RskA C-terminal domain-containing protein n=1 Tax=Sphingomonas piscis TaxID=2714943 RepID=A0A6G7YRJ1_9SPHN|nr:anti-sigma factor [Sphingomonas piscis]QIK79352.1 hypothetical protein G7077_11010 [Sphingomonas piscis]